MNDDTDIRVQLARMEGKQDVANERLNSFHADLLDIRKTLYGHGDRLGILEADKNVRSGERQGLAISGRILWSIIGAVPVGVGAIALKLLGA